MADAVAGGRAFELAHAADPIELLESMAGARSLVY